MNITADTPDSGVDYLETLMTAEELAERDRFIAEHSNTVGMSVRVGAVTGVRVVRVDDLSEDFEAQDFGWRDSEGSVWAYFDGSWHVHPVKAWRSKYAEWAANDPTADYGPYTMIEPQQISL